MSLTRNRFRRGAFPVLFEDAFFKDFFDVSPKVATATNNVPAVNVKESDKEFSVELAAPGLEKEDFNISIDENILTISSEHKSEETVEGEDGKYTRREFSYSSFSKSFTLDDQHVDVDNIKANYEAGVLKLSIPKKENQAKVTKSIAIE